MGALIVLTVLAGSGAVVSVGALAGGALTAALVYLLAFRRGGTSGYRLILIGIAIGYIMLSLIDYLLSRARIEEAQEATRWLLGSLNGRTWDDVVPLLISLAILLPLTIPAGRALRVLELGDDAAHGLGQRVERTRLRWWRSRSRSCPSASSPWARSPSSRSPPRRSRAGWRAAPDRRSCARRSRAW